MPKCTQVPISDKNKCIPVVMQSESIYVLKTSLYVNLLIFHYTSVFKVI